MESAISAGAGRKAPVHPGGPIAHLKNWRTWMDHGFIDALPRRGRSKATMLFSHESLMQPPLVAVSTVPLIGGGHTHAKGAVGLDAA